MIIVRISLAIFVFGGLLFGMFVSPAPSPSTAVAKTYTPTPTIDRSSTVQAKRKDLIERMVTERLISKVDVPGSLLTGPCAAALLQSGLRRSAADVSLVASCMGQASDHYLPRVFDAGTNKSVGRLTQQVGPVMN